MGHQLIKADPNEDLYLDWSSIVEAPIAVGTRDEMLARLVHDYLPGTDRHAFETQEANERLARADETGSSGFAPFGCGWDDAGEIYMQLGFLLRKDMLAAARLWVSDINEDAAIVAMIEPFEEEL